VQHYFRKNKKELNKKITDLFDPHSKKLKKYTKTYQRLSWLTHYYRMRGSLRI